MFLKKILKQLKKDKETIKDKKNYAIKLQPLSFFDQHHFGFKTFEIPLVSIIIPVYGQIKYTLNCLLSIYENEDNIPKEIIIVNDNSQDSTLVYLSKIKDLKILNNCENLGFLKSVNRGISESRGEFIYLLNNDTKVLHNYLSSLLEVFNLQKNIGAVGSKMIFANEHLQEAGCLLFKDQSIVNLGATKSPIAPQFNFLRKVDYCSGCSLLFRKTSKKGEINFLNEAYSPAYYEETDLCMRLKYQQDLDIYYQPASEIIHFENVSYGAKSEGKIALLQKNEKIFWKNWGSFIQAQKTIIRNQQPIFNENHHYRLSILILEEFLPKYDQDSGSNRFTEIIKILQENNFRIYLAIKNLNTEKDKPYISIFQQMGVEVVQEFVTPQNKIIRVKKQLRHIKNMVDLVWIFRPEGYDYWTKILRSLHFVSPIIYDMVDLHYLRFNREKDFFNKKKKVIRKENKIISIEQKALKDSDAIAAISQEEKLQIVKNGIPSEKIFVVSNIHQIKKSGNKIPFEARNGIIFIGGFNHKPNVDAVLFLKNQIMPLVWEKKSEIQVSIIGGDLPEEIKQLHSSNFQILGYQKNVDFWFENSRIFVAPLRYGAGVKGKIGQALEYQLPIISSPIGVEGMKLLDGVQALVAETDHPEDFAEKIINLYDNEDLWKKLHDNSESGLDLFSVETQEKNILDMINFLINKKMHN